MDWYKKTSDQTLKELNTGRKGLPQAEALKRLAEGANILPEKKKPPPIMEFLAQFKDFLIIILIIAAIVSLAIGEIVDACAILLIVMLNATFGFFQERKAEKAIEALRKIVTPKTHVVRDGKVVEISTKDVVRGDIVSLDVGDKVPADCRIIEQSGLRADESILTGESTTVSKYTDPISKDSVAVADRKNMIFSGTTIVYGRCKAAVVETGSGTEFGRIAAMLQGSDDLTPLQKKLEVLGKNIGIIVLAIAIAVFGIGFLHGIGILDIFLTAVSLAVAAIPEGLPAIVTITLSVGLIRMARKNSIIRKLPAVETLGSTTVICSDKTGTLTKNEMTVRKLYVNCKSVSVSGEGYGARGIFTVNNTATTKDHDIEMLLTIGSMCNNANFDDLVGDPTELALLVSARKFSIDDMRSDHKRIHEIEFDSDRKLMSVVYNIDGRNAMYTKGAVEEVLKRCVSVYKNGSIETLKAEDRKNILAMNQEFAGSALRVLAFATKRMKEGEKADEKDLVFVGLQGMIDPPRPEAKKAIETCRIAGIKVVMITGDHKDTAVAVAKELGLLTADGRVFTGEELDGIKDNEFLEVINDVSVYARVSPEHKVRITEMLKKKGHVVAMTGDGVNDAPALKKADIGIAMGISGTDVAKEISDMILTDDNFASIVSAVEEGRGMYDNMKKFIVYLLSCNMAEVIVVLMALLFIRDPATGLFVLPLLPVQLLWMNFATDGLPALALGVEPYETDIMKRKPRNPKEPFLTRPTLEFIVAVGAIIAFMTLYFYYNALPDVGRAQTIAFTSLVVFEMAVALSMRSPYYLFHRVLENKKLLLAILSSLALQVAIVHVVFLNDIFGTVPISLADWAGILVGGFFIFLLIEVNKIWRIEERITDIFVKHKGGIEKQNVSTTGDIVIAQESAPPKQPGRNSQGNK